MERIKNIAYLDINPPSIMSQVVTRKSIRQFKEGDPELDKLVLAWSKIQALPPTDPNSFEQIAGFHGEPFRGAGWGNAQWWGGYCNHGNVLFPTWHRAYVRRLEEALQSQVPGAAMMYWDELEEGDVVNQQGSVPPIFLQLQYKFADGTVIPNPLHSYTLQRRITDNLTPTLDQNLKLSTDYSKGKGYTTVRFPFSGLQGPSDIDATKAHNAVWAKKGQAATDSVLNDNVKTWLTATEYRNNDGTSSKAGAISWYKECLNAPNYTVFSNTTSAQAWTDEHGDDPNFVQAMPLEQPHNVIHLAVGGIQVPQQDSDSAVAPGANGDMGENDTAGFDPIFFFHHCFVDFMFWQWQQLHGATQALEIIRGYPGTNSVDAQGPTPGVAGGSWLTLDSALDPFTKPGSGAPMTSHDVVDIEAMGYTYQQPQHDGLQAPPPAQPAPILALSGVNRAAIGGSFVMSAFAVSRDKKERILVGTAPVLSRWHVSGCANCQNHLEVQANFQLTGWSKEDAEKADFEAVLHTRRRLGSGMRNGHGGGVEPPKQVPRWKLRTAHMS